MKILVRLPNWLGDMVMSVAFIKQLQVFFPQAEVSVIAKKGIHDLLTFFPPLKHRFIFSKEQYSGFKGLWKFGRSISDKEKFDLFFSLPDSFSSAFIGYATGAKKRIGYKKELRELILTNTYKKPHGVHRVEEYIRLLQLFTGQPPKDITVRLHHSYETLDYIVVNINSEASSRRLTEAKAVELLSALRLAIDKKIVLIGAPKEKEFVESVWSQLKNTKDIESLAGNTSLAKLSEVLASARLVISTDSGPAHLSNALGTHTVVLFGAGNENNTAPYNKEQRTIVRLGKLSCEPCQKNVCVQFGIPQCLQLLETNGIIASVQQLVNNG